MEGNILFVRLFSFCSQDAAVRFDPVSALVPEDYGKDIPVASEGEGCEWAEWAVWPQTVPAGVLRGISRSRRDSYPCAEAGPGPTSCLLDSWLFLCYLSQQETLLLAFPASEPPVRAAGLSPHKWGRLRAAACQLSTFQGWHKHTSQVKVWTDFNQQ